MLTRSAAIGNLLGRRRVSRLADYVASYEELLTAERVAAGMEPKRPAGRAARLGSADR